MRLKCVLYRDDEREPSILPAMQAPHSVSALRAALEKHTGKAIQLISFWSYRHNRYDALSSIDQLAQQEALLLTSSANNSSLRTQQQPSGNGDQGTGSHSTRSGTEAGPTGSPNPSGNGDNSSNCNLYRAQLWLETAFALVEQVDPARDTEEFRELANHVRHFAGNKHVSYELSRAARLKYGYLSRMFDRTREEMLHASGEHVRLLFYANNAWSTTDVMKHGFLLRDDLPGSFEEALRTGVSGLGHRSPSLAELVGASSSTTYSDGLAHTNSGERHRTPAPDGRGGADDFKNTCRHPFTFTSSMVHPKDKKPALKGPQKVLLCEVAPGRSWVVDEPITTLAAMGASAVNADGLQRPPEGYDSIVYEEERVRTASRKSTPQRGRCRTPEKTGEGQQADSHAPLMQVMIGLSHQALPRYLLTIEPKKPEEAPGLLRSIFGGSRRQRGGDDAEASASKSPAPRVTEDSVRSLVRPSASPVRTPRGVNSSGSRSAPARSQSARATPRQHQPLLPQTPTPERAVRPLSAPSRSRSPLSRNDSQHMPLYSSSLRGRQRSMLTPPQQEQRQPQRLPQQQLTPRLVAPVEDLGQAQVSPRQPRSSSASFAPRKERIPMTQTSPPQAKLQPQSAAAGGIDVGGGGGANRAMTASYFSSSGAPPVSPRQRTVPPTHSLPPPSRYGSTSPNRERCRGDSMPYSNRGNGAASTAANDGVGGVGASSPAMTELRQSGPMQQHPGAIAVPLALRCPAHPGQLMNIYCVTCRDLTCAYCASVGNHKGHEVIEAETHATGVRKVLQEMCHDLSQWLDHFTRVQRQLEAETVEAQGQQTRRLQSLRGQLAEVRRALDAKERLLTKQLADQGEQLTPPVAAAATVRTKYLEALRPLEMCLRGYQAGHVPPTEGASANRANVQLSTLQFLRTAPQLMAEAKAFFRNHNKQEETSLRAAITAVREASERADVILRSVNTTRVRQEVDALGIEHAGNGSTSNGRLLLRSPPHSVARQRQQSSPSPSPARRRALADTSAASRYEEWSTTSPLRSTDGVGRPLFPSARHKAKDTGVGHDDDSDRPSHPQVNLSLVERCLLDLQRGHIWAIQNASRFFCVGQTKAVCSTPFCLKGLNWELRIAPMPRAEEQSLGLLLPAPSGQLQQHPASPAAGVSVKSRPAPQVVRLPGVPPAMQSDTSRSDSPATLGVAPDGGVLSRATSEVVYGTHEDNSTAMPAFQPRAIGQPPEVADENQWMGIFLFPLGHQQRLDFRVIAFSEVSWTEWKVTGWTDEFAGKGWGLYPFLRRRDLMRLDKLARDNIVKICVTPISDLY